MLQLNTNWQHHQSYLYVIIRIYLIYLKKLYTKDKNYFLFLLPFSVLQYLYSLSNSILKGAVFLTLYALYPKDTLYQLYYYE